MTAVQPKGRAQGSKGRMRRRYIAFSNSKIPDGCR